MRIHFILVLCFFTGCKRTHVRTEPVKGNLVRVIDRHDVYAAVQLKGKELETATADSLTLTISLNTRDALPPSLGPIVIRVLDRHDAWVTGDEALIEVQRKVYLNSSKALRLLFQDTRSRARPPVQPINSQEPTWTSKH